MANRFWVGGTGTSTSTAVWSTSSGGTGGASVPGSGDVAIIDALSGGGTYTIAGSPTYGGFQVVNINKTDAISFSGNLTITANGPLALTGNSVTNRLFVKSSSLGTQRTIAISGTTVPTLTNADFQDTKGSGSTPWTGTSLGDCLGNSGITFTASTTQTYAGGTANWSSAAAWTSRVPLPQDDIVVNTTTAGTLTADMPRLGRNIDFTGFTRTASFASTPNTLFGNITLASGMTLSGAQGLSLQGRGAQTITSAGKSFTMDIEVAAFGGTYTQQDNFDMVNRQFTLSNGTWAAQAFSFGAAFFVSGGSAARTISSSGIMALLFTSGVTWNVTSTLTTALSGSTIKFTGNIATNNTFFGAGLTYGNFWWSNVSSTGTLIVSGANTFNDFRVDGTTARTVQFPAGTTQTVSSFTVSGAGSSHKISLTSSTPGTPATLSMASGRVNSDFLSIQDSNATGGAQWFAGQNSTNVSGNSGWLFTSFLAISGGGAMLLRGVGG